MIILLYFLLSIFIFLIYKKKKFDPISQKIIISFLFIWGISLFISFFNPYGLYSVSAYTYILLIISVFSFLIGFSSVRTLKYRANTNQIYLIITKQVNKIVYSKIYIITIFIFTYICLIILQKYNVVLLNEENFDRSIAIAKACEGSYYSFFYAYLSEPFFILVNFLCAYSIINYNKLYIIIIQIIYILVFSLLGGGRISYLILFLAIYFLLSIKIRSPKRNRSLFKQYLFIIVCIFTLYIFLSYLSVNRYLGIFTLDMESFNWQNIVLGSKLLNEHIITYLTLPFRLLDHAIKTNYVNEIGGYQLGLCTFDNIDRYLYMLSHFLGVEYKMNAINTIFFFQDAKVNVSPTIVRNYAYSYVLFYYLDYGLIGVFIMPYIFGALISKAVKQFYKKINIAQLILIFYLYYLAVYSVFTWQMQKVYATLFIVILYILSRMHYSSK